MIHPQKSILLTWIIASITVAALVVAALGISTDFTVLKGMASLGLFLLAALSLQQRHTEIALCALVCGVIFIPFFPLHFPRHIWTIFDIVLSAGIILCAYWVTDPHQKGTRFEQYVTTLFPESKFDIIDRTRDISKFSNRRVESDTNPDLTFREKKTGTEFAVECKWRAEWKYNNKQQEEGLHWNTQQNKKYIEYGKSHNMKVYIAIGIGGTPEQPEEVYFLEPERLHYVFLLKSLITSGKQSHEISIAKNSEA